MMVKSKQSGMHFTVAPMKKVLIALDYDHTAQKVAEKGFSLAKTMDAEVVLLHVFTDEAYYSTLEYSPIIGFSGFSGEDFSRLISTEGMTKASNYFLEKIKDHLGDNSVLVMVEEGDFAEVILKTARHIHADIIVMGSHSRRWLEKILMGSVTEKVLHRTSIPLFIIPTKGNKEK
jgi:nucleotide-binding universal stress UspA family protein